MPETYVTSFESTLDGAINSSVDTITLNDVTGAPAGPTRLIIEDEIILTGPLVGMDYTDCTRGAEGSTAASHGDGTAVKHILTAGGLDGIRADMVVVAPYADRSLYEKEGTIFFPDLGTISSPGNTGLAFRYNGTSWDAFGPVYAFKPLDTSLCTTLNSPTVVETAGTVMIQCPPSFSGDLVRGLLKSIPSTPYRAKIWFRGICMVTNDAWFGFGFRESSSGKMEILLRNNSWTGNGWFVVRMNSATTFGTNLMGSTPLIGLGCLTCLVIEDDGTDIRFGISIDGSVVNWLASEGRTAHMSGGPDQIVMATDSNFIVSFVQMTVYSLEEEF